MLEINELVRVISDLADAQVTWLSNFAARNLDWKKLQFKRCNDILRLSIAPEG